MSRQTYFSFYIPSPLSPSFPIASPGLCCYASASCERVRSACDAVVKGRGFGFARSLRQLPMGGIPFVYDRRPVVPFTKIPTPAGQGGSDAGVCLVYSSLSLRRSAFSATIRWSMQSWMSPSMKADRL